MDTNHSWTPCIMYLRQSESNGLYIYNSKTRVLYIAFYLMKVFIQLEVLKLISFSNVIYWLEKNTTEITLHVQPESLDWIFQINSVICTKHSGCGCSNTEIYCMFSLVVPAITPSISTPLCIYHWQILCCNCAIYILT